MVKLLDILNQVLEEEKKKRDRCLRIADRKYDKPSAYKSGAVVRCRQGEIWKGIKEVDELEKYGIKFFNYIPHSFPPDLNSLNKEEHAVVVNDLRKNRMGLVDYLKYVNSMSDDPTYKSILSKLIISNKNKINFTLDQNKIFNYDGPAKLQKFKDFYEKYKDYFPNWASENERLYVDTTNALKSSLNEAKQVGPLYHYTSADGLKGILSSNRINASEENYLGNELYYISFTRNKNFHNKGQKFGVKTEYRITLDGDKLSNRYKISPFAYRPGWNYEDNWEYDWLEDEPESVVRDFFNNTGDYDEQEERIFFKGPEGDIDNIKNYILSVDKVEDLQEAESIHQKALSQTEKEALEITYKNWDKFGGKECNNGFCDIFAKNLSKYLPGSKIMSTEDPRNNTLGHVWIEYNGKYFDAETPEGVDLWKQLPWMEEFFAKTNSYPTDIKTLNEAETKNTTKKFIVYPDFQGVDPANILGQNKNINVKDALGNEPNKDYNYFTTEKKDYVDKIIQNAQNDGWKSFPPIIAIPHPLLSGKYLIIDGNHRLGAFKIGKIPQIKATVLRYDDILLAVPGTKWQEGKTPETITLKDAKSKGIDLKKYFTTKDLQLKEEQLNEKAKESLHKWFKRQGPKGKESGWIDCNAPDGDGGYKSCGRKEGEKRSKYPACRPTAAQCKTPGKGKTWGKTK